MISQFYKDVYLSVATYTQAWVEYISDPKRKVKSSKEDVRGEMFCFQRLGQYSLYSANLKRLSVTLVALMNHDGKRAASE